MLSFLASLFRRKPQNRGVFVVKPPGGGPPLRLDPNRVRTKLDQANSHWATLVETLVQSRTPLPAGTDQAVVESRQRNAREVAATLTEVARQAFGLEPLTTDGAGWTDAEVLGLLTEYLEFCRHLLEITRPL